MSTVNLPLSFVWEAKYEVGHPEIDEQHHKLFDLGNEILSSESLDVQHYIREFLKYTRSHFFAEEELMWSLDYQDCENHCNIHNKLLFELNAISKKPFDTEKDFSDFKLFVYHWLIDHIMDEDQKLKEFYKRI